MAADRPLANLAAAAGVGGYIGAEVARSFAAEGARVFLAGRSRPALGVD
ncbi:hypothetical protein KO481_32805 [Nocardia sp. NEAU-G5]|uniref:Uncharacterized protein n=1 Tax=Nocardia albiluteola TaxID=2842303 RepID=A0ABS6B970_9NOCA|nr:hypothetical protein [Nocardia albiluteola]MBU3066286.1 hypothetical protein [Nocardia albiluteola]